MISMDQVLSTLPSNDQVLNFTKKRLGPIARLSPTPPSPLSFQSLSLPINMNNNTMNNNNNNSSSPNINNNNTTNAATNNNNQEMRSCSPVAHSPDRSYNSPSPHYNGVPNTLPQSYTDIRSYAETGHMYRRPFSRSNYEDEQND